MILLSRFFLGGLPDRIHPAKTYYGGLTAMGLGLVVLAMGPAPVLAVLATAAVGFGVSFTSRHSNERLKLKSLGIRAARPQVVKLSPHRWSLRDTARLVVPVRHAR